MRRSVVIIIVAGLVATAPSAWNEERAAGADSEGGRRGGSVAPADAYREAYRGTGLAAPGEPLLATPTICWEQAFDDRGDGTAGALNLDEHLLQWNCTKRRFRLVTDLQGTWVDDHLDGALVWSMDADGNPTNGCGGFERQLAAFYVNGSELVGGIFDSSSCTSDLVFVAEISARRTADTTPSPHSVITLDVPWSAVGGRTSLAWYLGGYVTNSQWDEAPNGTGAYTTTGFASSTLGDVTTFVNGAPISISGSYSHQVPGDFNGDGRDDIALVGNGPRADALKLGSSNGFITRAGFILNGSYDCALGLDYDADGDDDLVLIGNGPKLDAIKRGGPNGFVSGPPLNVPGVYDRCLSGDYNADGRGDIALVQDNGGTSLLKRSKGNGNWTNTNFTVTTDPDDATSGDFNGDGYDDLLLPAWGPGPDTWLEGTPSGLAPGAYAVGGSYDFARGGDFNGDGADDVLYYNTGSSADLVRRGRSSGPTASAPAVSIGFDFIPIIGDYDGNGTADVVWHAPGTATDLNWRGVR